MQGHNQEQSQEQKEFANVIMRALDEQQFYSDVRGRKLAEKLY